MKTKTKKELKSWAFRREFCEPSGGFVLAKSAEEAANLVNFAFGWTTTIVYCDETGEKLTI